MKPHSVVRLLPLALGVGTVFGVHTPPALAQGPDFLFRRPVVDVAFSFGYALPRGNSDLFDFTREQLTIDQSDFGSVAVQGEIAVRATDRLSIGVGAGWAGDRTKSEFRDWIGTDDLPIEQTTRFERVPVTLNVRGYFKDRQGNVVKSRLDESALGTIASTSGGAHVRGLGPSLGLDEVFRDHIANMERRDVGSRLERRWEERFQIPLALALLLLLVESAIGDAHARPLRRVRERFLRTTAAVLAGIVLLGDLSAPAHAAEDPGPVGYEQYLKGDYAGAAERWREGLIDEPDSPLLRFNLGAALFREGKFDEAAQAFAKVATAGDATWTAKAAYNLGNTLYRKGQAAESSEPKAAIEAWEQSLEAYRSAMSADPADDDPKFDYELVSKRLRALREKLEKEAQEQQQQQDQQQPQDQQQEQQPQDQQDQQQQGEQAQQDQKDQQAEQPPPEQQQAGEEQPQDQGAEQQKAENAQDEQAPQEEGGEQQPQEAAGQPPQQDAGEQGQQGEQDGQAAAQEPTPEPSEQDQAAEQGEQAGDAAAQPGDKNDAPPTGEGTPLAGAEGEAPDEQAARAVLDAVRREELGPDDVNRASEPGRVAEAFKDW